MKNYDDKKTMITKYRKPYFKKGDKREDPSESKDYTITPQDLLGSIYSIADDFWGFKNSGREGHPGACLNINEKSNKSSLVHGTDVNSNISKWKQKISHTVKPSYQNGLIKPTAFILEPYHIRIRNLMLYHIDCKIGCLDKTDLDEMKKRISENHPDPWEVDS